MSKKEARNINDETDGDDIDPSELIDTQENKPKITQHEDLNNSEEAKPKESHYKRIELKQVSKLTDDEKDYLINLYKNGGEDDYYKVYFYKNGTNKIVKKKQPPKYNTTKRLLEQQQLQSKPVMTTEQILMEHVIDLEAKYATLYQKHKKLKKNYKTLHEDIYYDEDDDRTNYKQVQQDNNKQNEESIQEQEDQQTDNNNNQSYNSEEQHEYNGKAISIRDDNGDNTRKRRKTAAKVSKTSEIDLAGAAQ